MAEINIFRNDWHKIGILFFILFTMHVIFVHKMDIIFWMLASFSGFFLFVSTFIKRGNED